MDTLLGRAFAEAKKFSANDKKDAAKIMAVARTFLRQRHASGLNGRVLWARTLERLTATSATVPASKSRPGWTHRPSREGTYHLRFAADDPRTMRLDQSERGTAAAWRWKAFNDEDFDSGTSIEFANGGYQVSYDRELALIGSHPGDKVVMCLISIPQLCPPGDNRGRSYTVTNIRTQQTWTLEDSQHMCGGA